MPFRVLQVALPESSSEEAMSILREYEILGLWPDQRDGRSHWNLLVPVEETEAIADRLEDRFGGVAGFRIVLIAVEAVLPRPQEPEPEPAEPSADHDETPEAKALRISREELYAEVEDGVGVTRDFLVMTVLSAIVAAVGLQRDDVAVIIGAMVIAPLLGPNVAMALAITLGDTGLLRKSIRTGLVGLGTGFVSALAIGFAFPVDASVPAIATRTDVSASDILLAFAAGAAGTLAFTRGLSGTVIGVMVAVALMPPLVTSGILMGQGKFDLATGAMSLTFANVICVNIAGIVTFLMRGVRPRLSWEAKQAKSGVIKAVVIWCLLLAALVVVLRQVRG